MILNGFEIMKPAAPLSDESNSEKLMEKGTKKLGKLRLPPMLAGDGSSIELAKRPRGRPPGSKNRPKSPFFVTAVAAEQSPAMHPYVLEIPGGLDIVDCLARFSKQRKLGICVLAATGVVANVTLRQPAPATTAAIVFHGRFEVLSISATFLPPSMAAVSPAAATVGISITFAGLQGQIVGGMVVGPLMAAGAVVVVVAAFADLKFHKLPVEDEVSDSISVSDGEEHCEKQSHGEEQQHYFHHLHRRQSHSTPPPAELCGMAIYGSNISSDIIFAGGSRPPPPAPY